MRLEYTAHQPIWNGTVFAPHLSGTFTALPSSPLYGLLQVTRILTKDGCKHVKRGLSLLHPPQPILPSVGCQVSTAPGRHSSMAKDSSKSINKGLKLAQSVRGATRASIAPAHHGSFAKDCLIGSCEACICYPLLSFHAVAIKVNTTPGHHRSNAKDDGQSIIADFQPF